MRVLPSTLLLAALSTSACVVVADDGDSALFVSNESDFAIHEMYVADIDNPSWGPNLLNGSVLLPEAEIQLSVECGTYDAMLIDETGAACEVSTIDLCFEEADWIITNRTCAIFEARAAAMAAAK
ncbi:MAG: hypothetical protein H0V17_35355 [Deltaproteobacteria bacterium]|nr:hypothetical protein [Deltaproteobacteria bacterium]